MLDRLALQVLARLAALPAAALAALPAAVLAALPQPAVAAQSAADRPPIRLLACDALTQTFERDRSTRSLVFVAFTNERAGIADSATFAIVGAGGPREVRVNGTFSPGALIQTRGAALPAPAGDAPAAAPGCRATYVHFADGSSWTAAATVSRSPQPRRWSYFANSSASSA